MSAKIIPFPKRKLPPVIELTNEMMISKGDKPLKATMTGSQLEKFIKAYGNKGLTLEAALIQASLSGFFSRNSIRN